MDIYTELLQCIVAEQEQVIGPLAIIQANKVQGVRISGKNIIIEGNGKLVIENVVKEYAKLFGKASIELCKESIAPILSTIKPEDLPEILI